MGVFLMADFLSRNILFSYVFKPSRFNIATWSI